MNWEKKFLSHKFNFKYRENYLLNYLFQCIASINDIFDDIQIFVEYRNQNVIHELIWHFDSNILSSYSEWFLEQKGITCTCIFGSLGQQI